MAPKIKLMAALKAAHDTTSEKARSLKTKAAQQKRYEYMRRIRMAAHSVLFRMISEGDTLVLRKTLFCSATFGSGAYGIEPGAVIRVENVSIDYFTFSSGGQVFSAGLFDRGWCRGSLEAVLTAERVA